MTDRRLTPANGRVAAAHLKGTVEAERYVVPEPRRLSAVVADLLAAPGGARDRQVLLGESFHVLELRDSMAFGYAERDGYVGWLDAASLVGAPSGAPTHVIRAARSYAKSTPGLKAMGAVTPLPFGARLSVLGGDGEWSRIAWTRGTIPRDLHVPSCHLAPLADPEPDPVAVAERLLGTPYLWGGNSSFGIDCSGLVQAALLACGRDCPGDSDLQEAALGETLAPDTPPLRGDLMFWKGHVAWVTAPDTLLHANAHHMAVAYERLSEAVRRIEAQGDGPVTRHARL